MESLSPLKLQIYDTEANLKFREAVIDGLIVPACMRASARGQADGFEDGEFHITGDSAGKGIRIECSFFSEKQDDGDRAVTVSFSQYNMLHLTDKAAHAIYEEVQASDLDFDTKTGLGEDPLALQHDSVVETYTHRVFYARLDGDGSVRAETTMGYAVNGREIDQPDLDKLPSFPFDLEHETILGRDEVEYLVHTLLELELIDGRELQKFVQKDWGVKVQE